MKPPEKIWLTAIESDWEFSTHDGDVEYVLAPVWHDSKEPPEENGFYLGHFPKSTDVLRWSNEDDWEYPKGWSTLILEDWVNCEPTYWTPLPQPPESEGE